VIGTLAIELINQTRTQMVIPNQEELIRRLSDDLRNLRLGYLADDILELESMDHDFADERLLQHRVTIERLLEAR
jgi:hypothetical protein